MTNCRRKGRYQTTRSCTALIPEIISVAGIICICIRVPQLSKKRKAGNTDYITKGTVTGYHLSLLKKTLDGIDRLSTLKGYCLVIDNATTHTSHGIETYIVWRGY